VEISASAMPMLAEKLNSSFSPRFSEACVDFTDRTMKETVIMVNTLCRHYDILCRENLAGLEIPRS
jgi:hypothetical protein